MAGSDDTDSLFKRALDSELEKICSFYQIKELEIYEELNDVLKEETNYLLDVDGLEAQEPESPTRIKPGRARQGSLFRSIGMNRPRRPSNVSASLDNLDEEEEDSDDEADEHAALNKGPKDRHSDSLQSSRNLDRRHSQGFEDWGDQSLLLYDSGINLKKRTISLYVSLCELKSYVQLNKTGFSKALKKYDKILDGSLKSKYLESQVNPAYPFRTETVRKLEENINKIEKSYADIVTKGDVALAKRELRLHLREHVVWERNTVWREMIGIERKAQAANLGVRRTLLGSDNDPANAQLQGDEPGAGHSKEIQTPVGRYRCPRWLFSSTFFLLLGIIAVFVVLLVTPIMDKPEQQNCLALLVFVSLLWATEAIPLFVTSLTIPFLAVVLRVARSDNPPYRRLEADQAAKYVFAAMWTPVIMLLLGGFTIAAALSKYDIAKRMAIFVLSKAGTRPRTVLIPTCLWPWWPACGSATWLHRSCASASSNQCCATCRPTRSSPRHSS